MKNKALTLTVVIPAYNEEAHLRQCLDSIARQEVMPDEVIVVDNNSSDSTIKIVKKYKFVTLITEKKQGVFHARNNGFDSASSDIIGRIDADTVLNVDWTQQVKSIFSDSSVQAATGTTYLYDMPLAPANYIFDHTFKKNAFKYDKNFPFLFGTNMAIRRAAWQKIKPEVCDDNDIHEDIDLAIHLFKNNMRIEYSAIMKAGMSARRYDDKPADFYKYNKMMKDSYTKHNIISVGSHLAMGAFGLGYVVLWPLRRSYDPRSGKRTIRQFVAGNKARKHPNAS
jgi:glycosyltransferase involved in cell wall biosynthesis